MTQTEEKITFEQMPQLLAEHQRRNHRHQRQVGRSPRERKHPIRHMDGS